MSIESSFTFEGETWNFVPPSQQDGMMLPITLRPGSYNMDGYMDLAVTLRRKNEK